MTLKGLELVIIREQTESLTTWATFHGSLYFFLPVR